ncbi:cell division protein FtsQ/DivIB [Aquipuribacter sp. SD81]|uniref:cell division protein FtsQ/DivIB n=1 Tax=Aquipuribacter sp. SD81 TaxID=3127703 RepID=UPI0030184BE0
MTSLAERAGAARRASVRARAGGLVVLLLVLAALAGAGAWAWRAGHLDTRQVLVTGTVRVPVEQVQAAAAGALGTPLLAVDTGAIAREVATDPLVLDVAVQRRWPRTLEVVVTEREAVAAVPAPGGYEVVDEEGVVLAERPDLPEDVPLLRVDVERDGADTLRAAKAVLAGLPLEMQARTTSVSATSPADVRLVLDGVEVRWGTPERTARKVEVLSGLMSSVEASVYDVSSPAAPAVIP